MHVQDASRMSRGLKAVSDCNRIRILEILCGGEHCVSDLVDQLGIDQPKVSHHLAILRSAGILRARRDGRHINYSIRPQVHRRAPDNGAIVDVFDLGELSISFRFTGTAADLAIHERIRMTAASLGGSGRNGAAGLASLSARAEHLEAGSQAPGPNGSPPANGTRGAHDAGSRGAGPKRPPNGDHAAGGAF